MLGLPNRYAPVGHFAIRYIPLEVLATRLNDVPSGTLLVIIREENELKVTRVTHLGFVIHREGKTFLRHATKGWKNAVIDEELHHFLARVARHNDQEAAWRVVGASLFEAREPDEQMVTIGRSSGRSSRKERTIR